MCNISQSTFKKIMNGGNFQVTALFRIARTIKIDVHQFFKNHYSETEPATNGEMS